MSLTSWPLESRHVAGREHLLRHGLAAAEPHGRPHRAGAHPGEVVLHPRPRAIRLRIRLRIDPLCEVVATLRHRGPPTARAERAAGDPLAGETRSRGHLDGITWCRGRGSSPRSAIVSAPGGALAAASLRAVPHLLPLRAPLAAPGEPATTCDAGLRREIALSAHPCHTRLQAAAHGRPIARLANANNRARSSLPRSERHPCPTGANAVGCPDEARHAFTQQAGDLLGLDGDEGSRARLIATRSRPRHETHVRVPRSSLVGLENVRDDSDLTGSAGSPSCLPRQPTSSSRPTRTAGWRGSASCLGRF